MSKNIEHTGATLTLIERIMTMVKKYTFLDWVKSFLLIGTVAIMTYCITQPEKVIKYFTEAAEAKHEELMTKRIENTMEIQRTLDKLLYRFDASRCVIASLHNGQNSINGIPFTKISATHESISDEIYPISGQYSSVGIGLIPFIPFLYEKGYFQGHSADIKGIDRSLSFRLQANEITWFAATVIIGQSGKPIAFIFLTYKNKPDDRTIAELESALKGSAVRLSVLLELRNR